VADLGGAIRDIGARFIGPEGLGRYKTIRSERLAGVSNLSWREFWRDLGFRFLIAGAIVAVVAITIALLNLFL
jgi:hypothetical protein